MTGNGLTIVGLGGSLKAPSSSSAALRIALGAAAEAGAATRQFEIATLELPMYDPSGASIPEAAVELCEAVFRADGMIWSSPLYHGTVSGSFKNALDWLQLLSDRDPPFLSDKVIGLISTGGGVQGLQAVNTMEFAVRSLRGFAVPLVVPVTRAGRVFDGDGRALDEGVEAQLRALGREVARVAGRMSRSACGG